MINVVISAPRKFEKENIDSVEQLTNENGDNDYFNEIIDEHYEFWKLPSHLEMENSRNALKKQCQKAELTEVVRDVQVFLNRFANKSDRLITTNLCESWMSIRAKFDGGKVVNRCGRGSWHARCFGGALRKNLGEEWSVRTFKHVTKEQGGQYFFEAVHRQTKKNYASAKYQAKPESKSLRRKRKFQNLKENTCKKAKNNYGSN